MISIAICDDEPQELEKAHTYITNYVKNHPQYEITTVSFSSPLELLSYVEIKGGYDIFLLDVYMAGMLGTDAARQLRQLGDSGEIIFITTSKNHAIDAFEVDAAQYLIKPYTENTFSSALDKVINRLKVELRHFITIKASSGIVRLFTRSIIFTETGRNNYQVIHTDKGEKIEIRMTASELFELLSQNKFFIRCGASINLNLKFIRQIKKDAIIFDTGEYITYPYRSYKKLKEQFLDFQISTNE